MRAPLRAAALLAFIAAALLSSHRPVAAKVYIDLDAPVTRRLPLAITTFTPLPGGSVDITAAAGVLRSTVDADLGFSGIFDIIEEEAYLIEPSLGASEEEGTREEEINFRLWRAIGAEFLIKGGVRSDGKKLVLEIYLFDTIREEKIMAKRYVGVAASPRAISHRFADDIMTRVTGKTGSFSTRLLFASDRTGTKEIYISDYDGHNLRQITNNRSINIAPRWSPDGTRVMYTSYRQGSPKLYVQDLKTGAVTRLSNKPGVNLGGMWSPDGTTVALTLSVDSTPELYLLDPEKKSYKRLTRNHGIDVTPTWSPDGDRIVYVSDIAGNPHIYMINSNGGKPKRLTFKGKFHSDPSWSGDGKKIAFSRLLGGRFNIWTMDGDGSNKMQITFEGDDKSPSWSPDGNYIVFARERVGKSALYLIRADGTGIRKIGGASGNESNPSWAPFFNMNSR